MTDEASELDECTFEEDSHTYASGGIERPSVTATLKIAGIYDFSMVKPEVLDRKKRIGKNVHRWTAIYDQNGEIDETWIADDEMGYFEAWLLLRREMPKLVFTAIERMQVRSIAGILVGGTPDRIGFLAARPCVLDIKCAAVSHPGWALQTADYEMQETQLTRCGHMVRLAAQLFPNGKYKLHTYENHRDDAAIAIDAVQMTASTMRLAAWMHNHGLKGDKSWR
jgi:hypothetical protein